METLACAQLLKMSFQVMYIHCIHLHCVFPLITTVVVSADAFHATCEWHLSQNIIIDINAFHFTAEFKQECMNVWWNMARTTEQRNANDDDFKKELLHWANMVCHPRFRKSLFPMYLH